VKELFHEFGRVLTVDVPKAETEDGSIKSRGFAIIRMTKPEEARKAVAQLSGTDYDGRTISVRMDRDRTERTDNFA